MLFDYTRSRKDRLLPVLVIEDDADHQLLIGYSLRSSVPEAAPIFSSSADEAMTYLSQCVLEQAPFPRLVLLDIHLPDPESGWQLLREFRARYPRLPIIVLSAYQNPEDVRLAYELGAYSFIEKPTGLERWEEQFRSLRNYWIGTVTLPPAY